jgi:hypothetical protein
MSSMTCSRVGRAVSWFGIGLGFLGGVLLAPRLGHAEAPAAPSATPAGSASPAAAGASKGALPPLPASSARGPASPPAAPPAAPTAGPVAPPPGAAPPPYMYQEPWAPPNEDGPRPPPSAGPLPAAYPSPYVYEPPPPSPIGRSPWNALWLGARVGALFPFGDAYATSRDTRYDDGEEWSGLATGGPSIEGDVGMRFARHYIVYGFWDHAFMGKGSDPSWRTSAPTYFGDQDSATTDFTGLAFRWSSRPERVGLVLDLGLGYRWFREKWSSGAKMTLEGFGEFRFGVGADIRVARLLTLSPLFSVTSGTFTDRKLRGPGVPDTDIQSFAGSHGTVTLSVGGHVDLFEGDR